MALFVIAGSQAALDRSGFELDADATNNVASTKAGVLNASVAAATGTTSIQICQTAAALLNGRTILIDAERLTLASGTVAGGGGCANKTNYTATRGANGTTPGAHAKAEDVTLLTFGTDATMSGDDWDQIYAAVTADPDTKCESLGAVECTFVADGRAMSIFTQSKDYDEISGVPASWQWRDSSVPDADELDHGFAAKYVDGAGKQNLYFGADRFATNGTKDAGFWFFHDTVAPIAGVGGADGTFSGVHTAPTPGDNGKFCVAADGGNVAGGQTSPVPACDYDTDDTGGDVLVLTTFTGGGATTTIRVFEWVGPAGSTAALLERGSAADCVPGDATQKLCATVNKTTVEAAWAYSGKGEAVTNEIPSGGLLEGGINLNDLGLEGCFSSFMATTRSSSSLTADPKDFILGSFEACGSSLTTDASSNSFAIGGSVTDSATITTTGGGPAPTGDVDFYVCGPSAGISSCDDTGTLLSSEDLAGATGTPPAYTVTSDSFTPTSAGDYCFFATWAGDDTYPDGASATSFTDECFTVTPNQPAIETQVDDAGPLPLGSALDDTATLSDTANQPDGDPAGGTITFTAYGPHADATTCTTVAYTSVVNVSGDGDYVASTGTGGAFTPTTAGSYNWIAVYSGDPPNTLGVSGACGDANEGSAIISLQPTMDTAQSFVPNDSATITVAAGAGNLAGSVVFKLFVDDTECSGTAAYTSDPIAVTSGQPNPGTAGLTKTVASGNTTSYSASGTTFSWIVTYTSTNTGHQSVSSPCGNETSSITIDNGAQQPPAGP